METASSASTPALGVPADGAAARHYYSISQAATFLGVSRVTIWRWIRDGRLPVVRLGHRTVRITHDDLDRLLICSDVVSSELASVGVPSAWIEAQSRGARDDLPRAGRVEPKECEHFVQFYEAHDVIVAAVGDFIGAGLRAGDAGIIISTEAHRADIERRLVMDGLDVDAARAGGRYISLNAAETLQKFMVGDQPEPSLFAELFGNLIERAADGARGVRIFGEMVALLVEDGNHAAALRLEELWNDLGRSHSFALMCGYPMDGFDGETSSQLLADVFAEHTRVIPAEGYTALTDQEDRLRTIAALQHKAHSLEAEIARRKQAEEQLQAALESGRSKERELSDFVETAPLGLLWIDADGTILWANRAEVELLGYSPEEYIAHSITEFHVDKDAIDDMLARLRRGDNLHEFPAQVRCNDGTIKYVLIDSSKMLDEGQFVYSRCFTRDVTELRRAEQERTRLLEREREARHEAQRAVARTRRLQEITGQLSRSLEADQVLANIARSAVDLLHAPVGAVFLLDPSQPDGDFTLAAANGIDEARVPDLRLPRHASLAGRAVDEGQTLVVDDVRETPGTALPALLTSEMAGSEIAAPITAGDARLGVVKAFSPTLRRFSQDDAALLTSLASAAAVALTNARLYRDAQDAIRARDEFLSAAAHDLKTPLTSLKGMSQLLRRRLARTETADTVRLAEGLASIDATATKMGHQLDELLDVTRLEMGQQLALSRHPTDIVSLMHRVASEGQQATDRHRIRVDAALPQLIGSWDEVRLGRVLDNLLSNAIKYSPAGGEIVVSVTQEQRSEGNWAVLAIKDPGLGIPAADLTRIFERFGRARNVEGRIGGTGIGLASVRQIVEQHGGTIAVQSSEGSGSEFTVRLPLAARTEHAAEPNARYLSTDVDEALTSV